MAVGSRSVHGLAAALFVLGAVGGAYASGPVAELWLLAPLALALVIAESLQVEFQYGDEVRAVDVFEAVLAPVLITFSGPPAVALAVVSKGISQHRLGIDRTKAIFNVAQWCAAVGMASLVYRSLAGDRAGTASTIPALVVALLVFAATNEIAMACVLRLVRRAPMRQVLADLAPSYLPHGVIWSINAALGVVFAAAVVASPVTALLLLGPLAFVRRSHQAFLSMRADRARLDGLARAVARLAAPIDPKDSLALFLEDVRGAFSSASVELVVFDPPSVLTAGARGTHDALAVDLGRILALAGVPCRASSTGPDSVIASALVAAGRSDVIAAPLTRDGNVVGVLASYDKTGFEGFEEGEEAVMVALADAVSRALEKSALLGVIVDERANLAEIVGRSSDGILTVGAAGVIESWNPAMEEMTGVPASEIVGTSGMSRFRPRDAQGNRIWFEHWMEVGIPQDVLINTATGGDRWLGCSSAVGAGGATLVVVARDVTRAKEIDQMKDDFIGTVSHELRTPLVAIRGFTELLDPRSGISDDMRSEALGRIRRGTRRLERLVSNLLEVTRIDARRSADLIPTELDIREVVGRVVEEVQESWPASHIEVDTGGGAWRAHGSLLSFERILVNLLSNALTYAGNGPVRIEVRGEGEDGVVVSVRDWGPGIPANEQERIFERFERLDTAKQKAGTGLGLYISRALARSMGAELTVKSEAGDGAEFTLHLKTTSASPRASVIDLVDHAPEVPSPARPAERYRSRVSGATGGEPSGRSVEARHIDDPHRGARRDERP
ncbi:MAG: ATP-binding protein [Actinomycetota bacterium]